MNPPVSTCVLLNTFFSNSLTQSVKHSCFNGRYQVPNAYNPNMKLQSCKFKSYVGHGWKNDHELRHRAKLSQLTWWGCAASTFCCRVPWAVREGINWDQWNCEPSCDRSGQNELQLGGLHARGRTDYSGDKPQPAYLQCQRKSERKWLQHCSHPEPSDSSRRRDARLAASERTDCQQDRGCWKLAGILSSGSGERLVAYRDLPREGGLCFS